MTYNLTIFLTSYSFMLPCVSAPCPDNHQWPTDPTKTHGDGVPGVTRRFARGAAFIRPPVYVWDGCLMCFLLVEQNAGEVVIAHTMKKDSHLNIIVKDNFKCSNDAELIKTSCNDERACRWDAAHINTSTQAEFLFHILSAGCVMMPFIKVGNYLTEVLCYWIWGQICRHNWRRVDVKSLSGHSEDGISIKGGGWMATHPPVTVSSPETLTDSTPAPPRNRPSVLLRQLLMPILNRSFLHRGIETKQHLS